MPITLIAVRIVEWIFTLLGCAGIIISAYTAFDAMADLLARLRAGLNGDLETVGRIALRGAVASMMLHAGLVFIGASALASPLPPIRYYNRTFTIAIIYTLVQLAVVFAQVRNQYDRTTIRNHKEQVSTGEMHG